LVFNGTRGAWIAVLVAFFTYGILYMKNSKKVIGLFIVSILMMSIAVASIPTIQTRVTTITDTNYQSNSERLLMWKSAWHIFIDHPITGIGIGNYQSVYEGKYILPEAKERSGHRHPHNNIMLLLAETGALGCISFIYLYGYILWSNYRAYKKNKANMWPVVASLVTIGLLTHGMVDYTFGLTGLIQMYWFILGITYVARTVQP
jgi:O-antigen ligase